MKVIQSYLQGARHKNKQQPCEDRTYSLSKNDVTVIALADGAGSKKYTHSAQGAECVTKTIAEFFCNNFDKFYNKENTEELCSVIMAVCQRSLKVRADEIDVDDIIKMSSTLLVVAVKNDKMIACHIGDGVIGRLTSTGTEVISAPDNGEFASTTYFITNPCADEHIHIIKDKTDDVISYFLMSDGTQEYVYDEVNKCFHDAARKMALFPFNSNGQEKLEQTIMKYMVDADLSSDDCSFICMLVADENFDTNDCFSKENIIIDSEEIIDSTEHNDIAESQIVEDAIKAFNVEHNALDKGNKITKKKKSFLIIITILIIAIFSIIIILSPKSEKTDVESTTAQSTTEESSTQENLTQESSKQEISTSTTNFKNNQDRIMGINN